MVNNELSYLKSPFSIEKKDLIDTNDLITVSVSDNKIANKEAFKILVNSILKHSPNIIKNFYLLFPKGEIEPDFIQQIRFLGIKPVAYELDHHGDPYKTKFLLHSFIKEWQVPMNYCLYLDPDHIALKKLNLIHPGSSILVSSETKNLVDICTTMNLLEDIGSTHFNTSIILGHIDMWKKIVDRWEETYKFLYSIISTRYLEEIAFCFAAKQANINTVPIPSIVQSNFLCFNEACSLFHYGGNRKIVTQTKKILQSRHDIKKSLLNLMMAASTELEVWFLHVIINALPKDKEYEC